MTLQRINTPWSVLVSLRYMILLPINVLFLLSLTVLVIVASYSKQQNPVPVQHKMPERQI